MLVTLTNITLLVRGVATVKAPQEEADEADFKTHHMGKYCDKVYPPPIEKKEY